MNILTDEEINQIKDSFDYVIHTFNNIFDSIINTISNILKELKELLDKNCLIIKRKRKGKRFITYIIKKNYIN